MATDSTFQPLEITRDAGDGRMYARWADGHESYYSWEALRWKCPCAHCQGEWGQPGALSLTMALTPNQTTLTDLEQVGRYAISLTWKDGHRTGIYTFRYLRSLCPCAECEPLRAQLGSDRS